MATDKTDQVEGKNPVLEALRGPREVEHIYVSKGTRRTGVLKEIISLAAGRGIRVEEVGREELRKMAVTGAPQGVVANVSHYHYASLDELIVSFKEDVIPLVLVLDGVEDPRNFGSLLRVSEATGVNGVIVARRRSCPVTAAVGKASAGAVEHVMVVRVANIADSLLRLKDAGLWVVGAEAASGKPYYRLDFKVPVAVTLGSEGKGLRRLIRERCDYMAGIPMSGRISSLNVATAGAVLLYEALRQRSAGLGRKAP